MILGAVTPDGVPTVQLDVAGQSWNAVVDTGFNGDLELPAELQGMLKSEYLGKVVSILAGGQSIMEDLYEVEFAFDGQTMSAEVTYAAARDILVGTGMLENHRLEVDFPKETVRLERLT